jgi:hypothetical protein
MSRSVTNKSVERFLEATHDKRFNPLLFASAIAAEEAAVQRLFFQICLSYLQIQAQQYANNVDYVGIPDIASNAYRMYNTYLESGGFVEALSLLNLNRFDT